jgi:hypothetical protein
MHERDVDHGTFIDDEEIGFERMLFVALKAAGGWIPFEEPVNGARFGAGGVGETFCGAAGGGAEETAHAFGLEDEEECPDECGFADAGSAGDDERATLQGELQGFALGGSEGLARFGFGPGDGFLEVDGRVRGWTVGERADLVGDTGFGALQ